jgi:hypothetical protein
MSVNVSTMKFKFIESVGVYNLQGGTLTPLPHCEASAYTGCPKNVHTLNVHNSHINRDGTVICSHLKSQMFKMSIYVRLTMYKTTR